MMLVTCKIGNSFVAVLYKLLLTNLMSFMDLLIYHLYFHSVINFQLCQSSYWGEPLSSFMSVLSHDSLQSARLYRGASWAEASNQEVCFSPSPPPKKKFLFHVNALFCSICISYAGRDTIFLAHFGNIRKQRKVATKKGKHVVIIYLFWFLVTAFCWFCLMSKPWSND